MLCPGTVVAHMRGAADAVAVAAEAAERQSKKEAVDAFMAHNEERERMGLSALDMPRWVLETIEELVVGKG